MNTKKFTDQLGRTIEVRLPTRTIVSVVPSQTELLYDLGLEAEVIGITKFCIHPDNWFRTKTRIGGTKSLNIEKIKALNPDIIIANKEENEHAQIEELAKHFPVWISDIKTLQDALEMIEQLGEIADKEEKAKDLVIRIQHSFSCLTPIINQMPKRCAYFIWWNPVMSINHDTFIHDMIERCGWQNVFGNRTDSRYPEIMDDELVAANPEIILLSSEPFPFSDKHMAHFRQLLPNSNVMLVDGEMFSWYGSRLLHSADYLNTLLETI